MDGYHDPTAELSLLTSRPNCCHPRCLQGVEEHLVADFLSVFSADQVFSTEDYAAYAAAHGPGTWPSAAKMRAAGRGLLLVSREDYGAAMRPLIFSR